jgi:hypothetical protein
VILPLFVMADCSRKALEREIRHCRDTKAQKV